MGTALFVRALLMLVPVSLSAALTPDPFRADLHCAASQLTATHPKPFYSTPASDFYAAAGQLDSDAGTRTPEPFYTRLGAFTKLLLGCLRNSSTLSRNSDVSQRIGREREP